MHRPVFEVNRCCLKNVGSELFPGFRFREVFQTRLSQPGLKPPFSPNGAAERIQRSAIISAICH